MAATDVFDALVGAGPAERALVRLAAPADTETVLVVGAGSGLRDVAVRAGRTIGVTTSPLSREVAAAGCRELGDQVEVTDGSATSTGLDDASVHVAVWLGAASPVTAAVTELTRVLVPGGRLLVSGPERALDQRGLTAVVRAAGFVDVQCWRYQRGIGGIAVQLRAVRAG